MIFSRLLDMLRLRSGPQDLPAGSGLAVLLAVLYLGQGFLADLVLGESDAAPRSIVAIALQFVVIAALLNARRLSGRIPQTISALSGTGFILGLASILVLAQVNPNVQQPGLALAFFGLFLWSLAVDGHIYRHALSTTMSLGVLIAVLIFAANYVVLRAIFG